MITEKDLEWEIVHKIMEDINELADELEKLKTLEIN